MSNIVQSKGHGALTQSSLLKGFKGTSRDLSEGVAVTFPLISLRGGKWRYRWKGEEKVMNDDRGYASPTLEVVIIDASKTLTKMYYENPYAEGQRKRPDCWSSDGKVPDASVPEPVSEICLTCPKNAFGSVITPGGKAAKACQDRRRIIISPSNDLENEALGGPILLSIPPGSLKNSQAYGDWLDENELAYYGCVTQLSFDQQVAHPKIEFTYIRPLEDDEVRTVLSLRGNEQVKRILNIAFNPESPENQVEKEVDAPKPPSQAAPAAKPATATPQAAPKPAAPQAAPKPAATAAKAGITTAVKNPATPPPSTRTVQTPQPKQPAATAVKPSPAREQLKASLALTEPEAEEDEQAPSEMDDAFAKLMNLE